MKLEIPKDCDQRRVKVSPSEAKLTNVPHKLLNNRGNIYGKIAVEDVYAALVMMCADGSITKQEVSNFEFFFQLIHPSNMEAGVSDLAIELMKKFRKELGTESQVEVKPFPAEFLKGSLLDPRLIGIWRQSEYYSSGDFYATTYSYIEFVNDGTFKSGSRVNASGTHRHSSGAWSGNTTGTSASGLSHAGKWETEEKTLVLSPIWGWEERLTYHVDDRGLLTQKPTGENKFYVRVG